MEWLALIIALWVFICIPIMGRRIRHLLRDQDTTISLLRRNDDTLRAAINDVDRTMIANVRDHAIRMDRIEAEIDRMTKEIIRNAT